MKFAAERRPSLKTEQPELTFGEVRLVAQPHAPTRLPPLAQLKKKVV